MMNKSVINVTGTILVNKSVETVFQLFADPSNDGSWRTEINQTQVHGALGIGSTISEYSYLSKKAPNNLLELRCVQFIKNDLAVFETTDNARFHLRSQRQVRAISDNRTQVIYTLAFDMDIVKFALGFALPKFLVSFKANSDMKKYLRQLKAILERN